MGWDEIRKQSFENEKKLGFWPADMKLPERIPPNQPWKDLTPEQKSYAARILAVPAAMIENMDHDVGRMIQFLNGGRRRRPSLTTQRGGHIPGLVHCLDSR